MKTILYNELNPQKIPHFKKIQSAIERNDFKSADVKKLADNLYCARLDISNRLLFSLYLHQNEQYALILEFIANHNYAASRFLQRGVAIDESKIPTIDNSSELQIPSIPYINNGHNSFHLLDKVISFDDVQQQIMQLHPPLIVIGSAGSGKTAITLEKMKQLSGEILYVTRSPYLVHHSRNIYYALGYNNEAQEIDFLSFDDFLASIEVPKGKELPFRVFQEWFSKQRRSRAISDPYQLFEEFKGVLTGSVDSAWMSREEYLDLGIRQSIYLAEERSQVYDLFEKYLAFLQQQHYYDTNILSQYYLQRIIPRYDFVVIDEVQDLTAVQLQTVLKSLHDPHQFVMCGDSNQIVHPNFFSWAKIKSLFYQQKDNFGQTELIRILNTNYRNSPEVTDVANRVLKLKTARFGSVDRESNYLVRSSADKHGTVILLQAEDSLLRQLNQKTAKSTRFAVIVMHPEQKTRARTIFTTPLVFSIQEAKGLEYENIILFDFTSDEADRYAEITRGIAVEDLQGDELHYSRAKDKSDKSLEIFKFHINALYVALTRAVRNIYLIESNAKQPLFNLLELKISDQGLDLEAYQSSLEEWRAEANKLQMQGKEEQAEEIRQQILHIKKPTWQPLTLQRATELHAKALQQGDKKAKLLLFEYALIYNHHSYINDLLDHGFKTAATPEKGLKLLNQKYFLIYTFGKTNNIHKKIDQYGTDFRDEFNQTPLMNSSRLGNYLAATELIDAGANPELVNNAGFNPLQIALEQACIDPKYATQKLAPIYTLLTPDSLTIQSRSKLIQLGNRLMEFVMFNLMMAMFYTRLPEKFVLNNAFTSGDFEDVLQHFPDSIISPQRKKRSYISSILSKNEINRDDRNNRFLFLRIKRGHYIINPDLQIRIEGEWHPIYQLLQLDMLGLPKKDYKEELQLARQEMKDAKTYVERMRAEYRFELLSDPKEMEALHQDKRQRVDEVKQQLQKFVREFTQETKKPTET